MSKIRKSARFKECQIRIPGVCNYMPETTVLAHLNGYGMGAKHADIFGAYACSSCHDVVDGRKKSDYDANTVLLFHMDGILKTQAILLNNGLLKVDK